MFKIGNLELENRFFLAPMEAVNCASYRVICKRRGASLIYTDMIDCDKFVEEMNNTSKEEAIKKLINPQEEEFPLAIQLAGSKIDTIKETILALEDVASMFDFNAGCPLSYMLGKKGGSYLVKHPDQLYKLVKEMRDTITKQPFTVKIRSGWDDNSINCLDVSKELEKLGVDAVCIHPRTKADRYSKRANWSLVRDIKKELSIPVILSGDVTTPYMAKKAINMTKCDFIMLGRAAKVNPSIFQELNKWFRNEDSINKIPVQAKTYDKFRVDPIKDFNEWLTLYKHLESRENLSEIIDHALWTATECRSNKHITQKIKSCTSISQVKDVIRDIEF